MSTTAVPFDPIARNQQRNAEEAARRAGAVIPPREPDKPVPGRPEEKPVVAPATEPEDHAARLPRSVRREQNRLREELGELRGRLKAYEELGMKPKPAEAPPATEDPEPARADFATDAEHARALGKWEARQEAQKTIAKRDDATKNAEQETAFRTHLEAMDAKAREDAKILTDWDQVAKDAAESDDAVEVDWKDHQQLLGMIGASDQKAFVLYHFAKNPAEFQKILDLNGGEQIRAFHRLEGRLEREYADRKPPAAAEKPAAKTAAERDAAKPKPSDAAAIRGGSAPSSTVSPVADDGKTLNLEWKERRNAATGRR